MTYYLFYFILLIIISVVIYVLINYKTIDNFNIRRQSNIYNYNNDGNMSFDYLSDPQYSNDILYRYYIDDDAKIGGQPLNYHPYKEKIQHPDSYMGARPYIYGIPWSQRRFGVWNRHLNYGTDIYNLYGVRR